MVTQNGTLEIPSFGWEGFDWFTLLTYPLPWANNENLEDARPALLQIYAKHHSYQNRGIHHPAASCYHVCVAGITC